MQGPRLRTPDWSVGENTGKRRGANVELGEAGAQTHSWCSYPESDRQRMKKGGKRREKSRVAKRKRRTDRKSMDESTDSKSKSDKPHTHRERLQVKDPQKLSMHVKTCTVSLSPE